jgi:hypothetical protein
MTLIDENAFGVLIAHYDLESLEYDTAPEVFIEYLGRFSRLVDERISLSPLATHLRKVELGHAYYFEFAAGDQLVDPITWVRETRKAFVANDLPNVCVLCEGGRWLDEPTLDVSTAGEPSEDPRPVSFGPSEPLRKALAAEAEAQPTTATEPQEVGWGPGLYVEKDAIERLGKSLKNAPTALPVLSSVFYRIGT